MMWMNQIMQQRGLMPPTVVNLAPTLTPSQVPTPTFVSKIENYEPVTAIKELGEEETQKHPRAIG